MHSSKNLSAPGFAKNIKIGIKDGEIFNKQGRDFW